MNASRSLIALGGALSLALAAAGVLPLLVRLGRMDGPAAAATLLFLVPYGLAILASSALALYTGWIYGRLDLRDRLLGLSPLGVIGIGFVMVRALLGV